MDAEPTHLNVRKIFSWKMFRDAETGELSAKCPFWVECCSLVSVLAEGTHCTHADSEGGCSLVRQGLFLRVQYTWTKGWVLHLPGVTMLLHPPVDLLSSYL